MECVCTFEDELRHLKDVVFVFVLSNWTWIIFEETKKKKEKQDLFFGYMECWKVDVLYCASKKFVAVQEENSNFQYLWKKRYSKPLLLYHHSFTFFFLSNNFFVDQFIAKWREWNEVIKPQHTSFTLSFASKLQNNQFHTTH